MKSVKSSAFSFMILVETSLFWEVVFFQYKSYWIISNYWINPSRKINVLIRRNFKARNNITEKCIECFCNFSFITYDFTLFNQRHFWRINRLVWKKRFYRFPESFIVSYMFFFQTSILIYKITIDYDLQDLYHLINVIN